MRVRRNAYGPPSQSVPLEQVQLRKLIVADSDNGVDRKQCREAPHSARERSEHTEFRAIVAVVVVEGIADEASVAGSCAKESHLPLELHRSGRQQWQGKRDARVVHGQPSSEIVAPVDNQAMAVDECLGVLGSDPLLDGLHNDMPVQPVRELRCHFGLGIARVPLTKHGLALEVGQFDQVGIDNRQRADPCSRKCRNDRAADAAGSNNCDRGSLQLALADSANLRKHDVPSVALELRVSEVHRPVEPKPPAPRLVSPSVSTSRNAALSTGAGTSWAIRSPRLTSKGSEPRLARMTLTSPR